MTTMQGILKDKTMFNSCFEKMKKHAWTCMAPSCNERSINSHVLQKNGILSQIAFNKHIIEVKPNNIWEMDADSVFKYQEIGINEAFTFPGFCAHHDSAIFKEIETPFVDFDAYKTQCLFSYRGLCQEIKRKKQIELFLNELLKIRQQFSSVDVAQIFEDYKYGLNLGIKNLTFFKTELERNIFGEEANFEFSTLRRPYFEVCTSAPINIKEPNEEEPETIEEYEHNVLNNKVPTTFVNVFPNAKESVWIIGEHKEYRSSYTQKLISLNSEQALSELLILRMEYWCMSHSFFNKHIKPRMKEIKKTFRDNVLNFEADSESSINLFQTQC